MSSHSISILTEIGRAWPDNILCSLTWPDSTLASFAWSQLTYFLSGSPEAISRFLFGLTQKIGHWKLYFMLVFLKNLLKVIFPLLLQTAPRVMNNLAGVSILFTLAACDIYRWQNLHFKPQAVNYQVMNRKFKGLRFGTSLISETCV